MNNAKLIGYHYPRYKNENKTGTYRYRGREYIVEFYPSYREPVGESVSEQHRREQARIDREIEEPESHEIVYERSADKALDALWAFWQ